MSTRSPPMAVRPSSSARWTRQRGPTHTAIPAPPRAPTPNTVSARASTPGRWASRVPAPPWTETARLPPRPPWSDRITSTPLAPAPTLTPGNSAADSIPVALTISSQLPGTTITSYEYEISTDGGSTVLVGPVDTTAWANSYGNTGATSSPYTEHRERTRLHSRQMGISRTGAALDRDSSASASSALVGPDNLYAPRPRSHPHPRELRRRLHTRRSYDLEPAARDHHHLL